MAHSTKKLTYEEIKKYIENEGYILISDNYINSWTKLKVECPNKHIYEVKYNVFQQGRRCKLCNKGKKGDNNKNNIDFIKSEFNKELYEVLQNKYIGAHAKIKVRCPKGKIHHIPWSSWRKGVRCKCLRNITEYNLESVKKIFEKNGFILLSDSYQNMNQKLKFICDNGHINSITLTKLIHRKYGCSICSNRKRKDINQIRKTLEEEGYKLLSKKYKNNFSSLECQCKNNHIYETSWHKWTSGCRCPICFLSGISKTQLEIFDIIKENFPDAESDNKSILNPKELDIFIPSKNIAIEYCGLYWHSENNGKDKNYHLDKLKQCQEKGIRLITIFEDEWIHKQNIVMSSLKNILNISNPQKVYARNCEIREINTKTKDIFLNENHLQGKDSSSIKLGATHNRELVSVMTFSKGSIAKGGKAKEGIWELNRFCSKTDYRIIGIASKLFKHFVNKYNPTEVYSYSDRRWFNGNLYINLGFKFEHHSQPNYWYVLGDKRIHRFNFRKNVLENKLTNFNPTLSEWRNMQDNGYDRIWDCGNTKWIWRNYDR